MNLVFEKEIITLKEKYPNLISKKKENGGFYLKGILDIPNDNGIIVGSFSVEIHATEKFPYRFPKLFEVGGDIPCEADWHKYQDNSCCLTVCPDEILKCYKGLPLIQFIETTAIPYFANQIYRKETGSFLQEYSHGKNGLLEFYKRTFNCEDITAWKTILDNTFGKGKFERNAKCYCGSNLKYKKCHSDIENTIKMIGKDQVISDLKSIIE